MVVDDEGRLIGTLTDGDIRRSLVKKSNLNLKVKNICNKEFFFFDKKNQNIKEIKKIILNRTNNIDIVDEDVLLVHPNDAKYRELNSGDVARLYSGRGEVSLKVQVTDRVKEGIVFTTFHFPEHMVNMVTGHGKDEETMCAEYKVSSVEVQKISNKFKTEVVAEKDQAQVV